MTYIFIYDHCSLIMIIIFVLGNLLRCFFPEILRSNSILPKICQRMLVAYAFVPFQLFLPVLFACYIVMSLLGYTFLFHRQQSHQKTFHKGYKFSPIIGKNVLVHLIDLDYHDRIDYCFVCCFGLFS